MEGKGRKVEEEGKEGLGNSIRGVAGLEGVYRRCSVIFHRCVGDYILVTLVFKGL